MLLKISAIWDNLKAEACEMARYGMAPRGKLHLLQSQIQARKDNFKHLKGLSMSVIVQLTLIVLVHSDAQNA